MTENMQMSEKEKNKKAEENDINVMSILTKFGVFHQDEIKDFSDEYAKLLLKTKETNKTREDFIRYASHVKEFLHVFRKKQKKINMKKNTNVKNVLSRMDREITRKVSQIYSNGCSSFPTDLHLWNEYIDFCKEQPILHKNILSVVKRMLRKNSSNETLFINTATWLITDLKDMTAARTVLQLGLEKHSKSNNIYYYYFDIELVYASCILNRVHYKLENPHQESFFEMAKRFRASIADKGAVMREISEKYQRAQLAERVYTTAETNISDIKLYIDMLLLAEKFPFSCALQARILDDLRRKFPRNEKTWDNFGRRELIGYSHSRNGEEVTDQFNTLSHKQRIRIGFQVYKNGLNEIKSKRMWRYYLHRIMEYSELGSSDVYFRTNIIMDGLDQAYQAGMLAEKHYVKYFEVIKDTIERNKNDPQVRIEQEKMRNVLNSAIKIKSALVWNAAFGYFIDDDNEVEIERVFKKAIEIFADKAECLPLWQNIIEYYQKKNPAKAEKIFIGGLFIGPEISSPLKSMYPKYVAKHKDIDDPFSGIRSARNVYDQYCNSPPYLLHMHLKMIELERNQPEVNIVKVRNCFETALKQFGKVNEDLWLDYIKFKRDKGASLEIDDVAKRAYCTLDPELVDKFREKYSTFKLENPLENIH